MSNEKRSAEQNAGSQIDNYLEGNSPNGPAKEEAGEPSEEQEDTSQTQQDETQESDSESTITEQQYKELEKKLGSQGEELGKYRKLFEDTAPLLEKLNNDPELAKAILEDRIDSSLVKDVVEGKTSQEDAEAVSQANKEVKQEVGEEGYANLTSKQIEDLIEKKVNEREKKITQDLNERERMQEYQKSISDFIANTPDFAEYADEIDKFVEQTGVTDIKVAYDAVKGKALQRQQEEQKEDEESEAAKKVASNAAGGSSQASGKIKDEDAFDKLVGKHQDPNAF